MCSQQPHSDNTVNLGLIVECPNEKGSYCLFEISMHFSSQYQYMEHGPLWPIETVLCLMSKDQDFYGSDKNFSLIFHRIPVICQYLIFFW